MYTSESIDHMSNLFLDANEKLFKVKTVNERSDKGSTFCYKCQHSQPMVLMAGVYSPNMYCLKGGFLTISFNSCTNGIKDSKKNNLR